VDVAVQVTRELGIPLLIAGQGSLHNPDEGLAIDDPHVTHLGTVGPTQRAVLMGGARMAFAPTYYIEPFGGVAVEAQLCGTPVLTTDWGAFSETVLHGVTGYRCRTFDDFVWAADNVDSIDPADCRSWAADNYSLARVQWMFQEYFDKIADLAREGWYETRPQRAQLDWLRRRYPARASRPISPTMEKAYDLSTA
jgi:glycosyltransferase involved in cell wall biosynthesis